MNVLILMEDALRYDAYYGKEMQPLRDYLGPVAEYQRWYSVNNCSDPNIASMLTGMYPWEHGVRYMGQVLSPQYDLFRAFHHRRYTTIFAGWGRGHLFRAMDLTDEVYSPGHIDAVRGDISARFLGLLQKAEYDDRHHKPWAAWVRHMWCHARYVKGGYKRSVAATAEDLIGLIGKVREKYPNTMVVITSDHGEMMGGPQGAERGSFDAPATPPQHAWGLFEPIVHVPMVVSYPVGSRRSQVHTDYYQHTDLMALVLGHAMLPSGCVLMEGTGVDPTYAPFYHRGIIEDGVKFILGGKDGAQDPLLYLSNAQGLDETHNQAQAFPATVRRLAGMLGPHVAYAPAEEKAVLERLAALGYGE